MTKSVKRYCKRCKLNTYHDQYKDINGAFLRIFVAIGSFGFSELMNDTIFRCQQCGKKIRVG